MVVGSEDSSDPERDENNNEPVAELGEKLINIILLAGSDDNQAPGVHARLPPIL